MEEEITPFDLQRMFLGSEPPLFLAEIAARTFFMYLVALLLVRFIGKRGMQQMTPVELLIVIALGSAVGDPMFYPEVPLLHGFIVLLVVVALESGIARWKEKKAKVESFFDSSAVLVVRDGAIQHEALREESMSQGELMMKLREHGICHTGEVERAYLEPSGTLSVFRSTKHHQGDSTFPDV